MSKNNIDGIIKDTVVIVLLLIIATAIFSALGQTAMGQGESGKILSIFLDIIKFLFDFNDIFDAIKWILYIVGILFLVFNNSNRQ